MSRCAPALFLLAAAVPAAAQDDFPHGRVRHVEAGVTLQRATETAAEEAAPNLPFLPGDRIWTDDGGRAEFQFADALLRLDRRSKLDYVAHDEDRQERVVLRLWSGSLFLRLRETGTSFEIETPGGLVEARRRGVYRVDTDGFETQLSAHEGGASLDSGRRRVEVEAGEQTRARRGEPPEPARRFDRANSDEFAHWESQREGSETWAGDSRRYLPEELETYAGEFDRNGTWYYEAEVGHVWRPYVVAGWRPYFSGYWAWTPYGWTWIPGESWGWAPSHYGRWGLSASFGWYWIPGRVWSPAWVSWAVGSNHVGWCPLGRGDRPVTIGDGRLRGSAVLRANTSPWSYVRRGDIGARDLARRRVEVGAVETNGLRVADATRERPSREFRIVEAESATPRNVRTKPSPGDTVPELRTDPATTIPFPVIRRSGREGSDSRHQERRQAPEAARERAPRSYREVAVPAPDRPPRPAEAPREQPPSAAPRGQADDDHDRHADPNRDVLRQMFRRFSDPRPPRASEPAPPSPRPRSEGVSPRGESSSRPPASTPPPAARTSPPPRSDGNDRAVRRPPHKEKDQ